ncbi:acetyltransferase [Histoplasma capsulatum]|uniref:Acetyltransferase n=1 Tax=Ajellomyces capsulatus TaxID=5037 RepID=A0A8A1M563_AJECA|nr:conserved hypothetical protein [Histoplasma mississippiense (nom. inval.)]EDN04096.1 conserved hypothetical protein [Histoplasma mississippiense (nom. inval.)]QSS59337.1 acetyltransferase [Histoplasma capsulatum]
MAVSTIAKGPKKRSSTATAPSPAAATVIAYALYVRQRGIALLHKLCVAEPFRGQGVGRQLLTHVIGLQRSQRSGRGCLVVQLWVDEKREAARRLYGSWGLMIWRVKRNGCLAHKLMSMAKRQQGGESGDCSEELTRKGDYFDWQSQRKVS